MKFSSQKPNPISRTERRIKLSPAVELFQKNPKNPIFDPWIDYDFYIQHAHSVQVC